MFFLVDPTVMYTKSLTYSVLLLCCLSTIKTELYTAITELEELLVTESSLIENLNSYIQKQEEKINLLKRYIFFRKLYNNYNAFHFTLFNMFP